MFVISTYSRRARGHVVACGLLRVTLSALAGQYRERLREAGFDVSCWPERVAAEFSGYLVTEPDDLPVWRDSSGRLEVDLTACTSNRESGWPWIRFDDEAGGSLDAPRWIAAGGMSAKCGEFMGMAVLRESRA